MRSVLHEFECDQWRVEMDRDARLRHPDNNKESDKPLKAPTLLLKIKEFLRVPKLIKETR